MEEATIELFETETEKHGEVFALPTNFVSVGTVERESVQVYIKQEVYKRIEKFAKEEMSKEVGSILIGRYMEEGDRKTVVISDYIEAKYTDASASTLTFTHDTWDYVYKEKDKKYADKVIVGWQHTHPGYGIFLSNYDLFIQENFFNLPWQVAYVVDPIADTRGFFEWKDGKVSKLSGFYVYDEVGRPIKISQETRPVRKKLPFVTVLLSFFVVVSVLLAVSFGIEKHNLSERLNETLLELKQQQDQGDAISEKQAEEALPEGVKAFRVYTVEPGDCLETICAEYGIDYGSSLGTIMQMNGIDDADEIYAGQTLYLPYEKGETEK